MDDVLKFIGILIGVDLSLLVCKFIYYDVKINSSSAEIKGSRNYAGVSNKAVDFLIDKIIAAKNRKDLISATKSLDRVLLFGYYVVPHWHIQNFRIAYWDKFGKPKINPKYDLGIDTWWYDNNKVKLLENVIN